MAYHIMYHISPPPTYHTWYIIQTYSTFVLFGGALDYKALLVAQSLTTNNLVYDDLHRMARLSFLFFYFVLFLSLSAVELLYYTRAIILRSTI